jgi:D-lactate dehydrogenase
VSLVMKIAVFEVEPWEQRYLARAFPDEHVRFFEQPLDEQSVKLVGDTEILSVFIHSYVNGELLRQLPDLRFIATRSTGYDHIDLDACNEREILVSNVPHYGETTVAEHTFGLMLSLSRRIHKAYLRTTHGDFSLQGLQGFDLKDKTLGVVGGGSIGLHVIRIARGFGMKALVYDPRENRLISEVLDFQYTSLDDLLRRSDIISLHAPYMPQTHHLINRDNLQLVKHGALLINTARGGLVDTEALIWALDEGILGGVGLDVLEGEDIIQEETQLLRQAGVEDKMRLLLRQYALLRREDVVVTPHIGFYSREAVHRILDTTIENVNGFLEGRPMNMLNAISLKPNGVPAGR